MKRFFCMMIVLTLMLSACGREAPQETASPSQLETVMIDREELVEGKSLVIHTQVELPDFDNLEMVTLVFDEDKLQTMVRDLIQSVHPDIQESLDATNRLWDGEEDGQLTVSLACRDEGFEAGWVYYLDASRDRNGNGMGEDDLSYFTYGYETPHVPTGLEITGGEAGQTMADFLGDYSCFTYTARSIIAQDAPNGGYYQAAMEPQLDGVPVVGQGLLTVSACISEEGVFSFQGIVSLKELSREKVEAAVTLEQAVEAFREELPYRKGDIEVTAIRPGYIARSGYGGAWTLRPAWLFTYTETSGTSTDYETLAVRMEDGKIQIIR